MLRGFSRKSDYANYLRGRSLGVLSDFSKTCGFTYKSYTYVIKRAIPSARVAVTTPSPHRSLR